MINIIVGTETGTAEFVADDIHNLLQQHDLDAEITLTPGSENVTSSQTWIICTSTHGAGDIPNNLQAFSKWLESKPDLSAVKYMIIGLGDSSYDRFCGAAKQLNEQLAFCSAQSITDLYTVDAMADELPEDLIIPWLQTQISKLT